MNTATTPRKENIPKYTVVADKLVCAIRDGTYRPGDLLPSESELTRRFDVSRHTIRSALRSLYEKGLIVSQRGRGSIVQAAPVTPRYTQAWDSIEDILQYAHETPRDIVDSKRITVDKELSEWLQCSPGYQWWEIHTCRHSESGGPIIASSQVWVPGNFGNAVAKLAISNEPLFVLIEREYGCTFAEIRQTISIAEAVPREARDLNIETGSSVMCVERRFTDERGGVLEVSRTVHPVENFRYESSLRRVVGG
ncbi:MAG: GntR family transcriptional regulator [Gammaproteobacteria bacterium]